MENADQIMTTVYEFVIKYGFSLLAAVIIFIVGKWLSNVLARLTDKMMTKANVDPAIVGFTRNMVKTAVLVFTVVAAIGKLGVETTSFIAVLGAAGLAVGLALQGTLSNFASGIMLIIFRPFRVGDFIEGGGVMGTVKEIQIFVTIMATPDNRKIIMPNSKIAGDTITNFTHIEQRRIDMVFGVSYSDDLKKAKEVLQKLVEADERVLKDPAPVIAVSSLGDSSVNIICRPWVKPADYWAVCWDLTEKGKFALEEAGMTIPFPQRDIHVYNETK